MSFTYDFDNGPATAYVRLLISDTDSANAIFSDEEITAAYRIQASTFQSSMRYPTGTSGATLPSSPVSYLRVAALLLDAIAANKSRLGSITQLLDVKLSPEKAAAALREQAQQYRTVDDESGAFMIIEQCTTSFTFRDRFYKTIQRQAAGV
jgi:hypothetical protein